MSAYKLFENVQFPNANLLVSALLDMGYEAEVGPELELRGWGKNRRTAQIVVRHEQIEHSWYDLGFTWNGQAFVPIIEDYAARTVFNAEWQQRLQAVYAKQAILTFLARKGAKIGHVSHLDDGSVAFTATVEVR